MSLFEYELLLETKSDLLSETLLKVIVLTESLPLSEVTDSLCEAETCVSLSLKLLLVLLLPEPELRLTVSLFTRLLSTSSCLVSANAVFAVNTVPPATTPNAAAPFNAAVTPSELNLSSDFLSFSLSTTWVFNEDLSNFPLYTLINPIDEINELTHCLPALYNLTCVFRSFSNSKKSFLFLLNFNT
ncbi:hypothetical protein O2U01_02675 [Ligilactobacillus salivarius]|nr:hypothetical protein [Ligilactobacillus salivarius]WHS07980.1 hypothetical protein O2U05_09690 [Ligilactobacillus salivarius]WHS20795.1 hypothetical protein O2U01_02675 [Ligilactobacillus salivarius]WHS22953.1 hypothetical protein O2U08_02680 [Ligilactobacillus salivarius]